MKEAFSSSSHSQMAKLMEVYYQAKDLFDEEQKRLKDFLGIEESASDEESPKKEESKKNSPKKERTQVQ